MSQNYLFETIAHEKYDLLSRSDLITWAEGEQSLREQLAREVVKLRKVIDGLPDKQLSFEEEYINLKNRLFGKSSEKKPRPKASGNKKSPKSRSQLPSDRYPNLEVFDQDVVFEKDAHCDSCNGVLVDTGLVEVSEQLICIPRRFTIVRQKRHKYRCQCNCCLVTVPAPARIKPGSAFGDEMIIDVGLSKYCDLIPIERYAAMARRDGVELAANSLVELTHYLANFLEPIYELIKEQVLSAKVLHADETPHRMLEGDDKSRWYLWGFSSTEAVFFDARPTRSGDVATDVIELSKADYIITDVYSGYSKAVREGNVKRLENNQNPIKGVYCNAHARRKFVEAHGHSDEAEFFTKSYSEIYKLEQKFQDSKEACHRQAMKAVFKDMEFKALETRHQVSSKSTMGKAVQYFLNNYDGLIEFTKTTCVPIDNNHQERLLRSPVVGRKTWYGNHSKKGARTSAILFSIVESCKLGKVNPRKYFRQVVQDMHDDKKPYPPSEYRQKYPEATG